MGMLYQFNLSGCLDVPKLRETRSAYLHPACDPFLEDLNHPDCDGYDAWSHQSCRACRVLAEPRTRDIVGDSAVSPAYARGATSQWQLGGEQPLKDCDLLRGR